MSRLSTLVSTLASAVAGGFDDLNVTETETRTYPAPAGLAVETQHGAVTIQGEDRDDVAVTITKRATDRATLDTVRVRATGGDGDVLTLHGEHDERSGNAAVDFDVAVPVDVPVASVLTKNGRVDVDGTTGDAEFVTKNGAVAVADHDGDVEVTAKNGSVTARDVTGDLVVAAKNGRVAVERLAGYLDVRTKNGSVRGRDVAGVDRAESKNGSIDLDVDALRGDATVATKFGSILLAVGPDLDADVTLATGTGSIDAPALAGSGSRGRGGEHRGTLGRGGHRLTVESDVGSIAVTRR